MSQNQQILRALQKRPLTPADAFRMFGCMRLAARIKNLRDEGHNITTQIVRTNGKHFAMYRLVQKRRAA